MAVDHVLIVFYSVLCLASGLAGLSSYLYSSRTLQVRWLIGAFVYSGLMGVLSAFAVSVFLANNSLEAQAAAALAGGFAGPNLFDFVLYVMKAGGIRIVISVDEESHEKSSGFYKKRRH